MVKLWRAKYNDALIYKIELKNEAVPTNALTKVFCSRNTVTRDMTWRDLKLDLDDHYLLKDFTIGNVAALSYTKYKWSEYFNLIDDEMVYKPPLGEVVTFTLDVNSKVLVVSLKLVSNKYVVMVDFRGSRDSLKLDSLPVNLKYMVYYLRETLDVKIGATGLIESTSLKFLNIPVFKEKMAVLE